MTRKAAVLGTAALALCVAAAVPGSAQERRSRRELTVPEVGKGRPVDPSKEKIPALVQSDEWKTLSAEQKRARLEAIRNAIKAKGADQGRPVDPSKEKAGQAKGRSAWRAAVKKHVAERKALAAEFKGKLLALVHSDEWKTLSAEQKRASLKAIRDAIMAKREALRESFRAERAALGKSGEAKGKSDES